MFSSVFFCKTVRTSFRCNKMTSDLSLSANTAAAGRLSSLEFLTDTGTVDALMTPCGTTWTER